MNAADDFIHTRISRCSIAPPHGRATLVRNCVTVLILAFVVLLLRTERALSEGAAALNGQVTSTEEGRMEGVLVSAKNAGSTITVTVVTDQQGRYRFPAEKLDAGHYDLRIRAVGYDLEGAAAVDISPEKSAVMDLKLRKTTRLASQLTNAEWLLSFPGTDDQKASIQACTHCHTLERIVRSNHDANDSSRFSIACPTTRQNRIP